MKNSMIAFIIFSCLIFTSCASQKKKDSTITISGAFAIYPLVVKWAEEYNKTVPDIRFNISGGGAGKGMADALSGAVDLGMFSRSITQEEKNKGAWWVGLSIDAVLPTISAENPFLSELHKRGLTREEFAKIFLNDTVLKWSEIINYGDNEVAVSYTRSDACGAAETWAKFLGGTQESLHGVGIFGDPGLAEAVSKDKYGIGYNNTIFVYDRETGGKRPGIEIIPIDINENGQIDSEEDFYNSFDELLAAISRGVYPSPPARELYFVSKGKPIKKQVKDFICWTLTEGQKFVTEAGYVPISEDLIQGYLEKLKD